MSQATTATANEFGLEMRVPFRGPERRRYRVFLTRNTEYHFRDGLCVAVRDRELGAFLHGHLALRRRVKGGLRFFLNGAIVPNPGEPAVGEALYFASEGRDLVTSPLEAIERPSPETIAAYPDGVAVTGGTRAR